MLPGEDRKGEPLREAVRAALAGRPAALDDLFARHGGGPDPRPNLKLAAAFGDEVAAELGADARAMARLLGRLAADDAAPDTPSVFLPMAAAHGYVGLVRARREPELAWAALGELAGDERAPVRAATHAALLAHALLDGGARELVARAEGWLEAEDREIRFGAAAVVAEVLGERQALAGGRAIAATLGYLGRVIGEAAGAPRSAERSDARRRLLAALPRALAAAVAVGAEEAAAWLEAECAQATQTDVRSALSEAVILVQAQSPVAGQRLRKALETSAKPPRDPTRIRPGAGRGRSSRRTR
jgi:hypothetical protein